MELPGRHCGGAPRRACTRGRFLCERINRPHIAIGRNTIEADKRKGPSSWQHRAGQTEGERTHRADAPARAQLRRQRLRNSRNAGLTPPERPVSSLARTNANTAVSDGRSCAWAWAPGTAKVATSRHGPVHVIAPAPGSWGGRPPGKTLWVPAKPPERRRAPQGTSAKGQQAALANSGVAS